MATTRKDGKERRGLSPPAVVKHVRSSSISPSAARSIEKDAKPVPNYLKPTFSSNHDSSNPTKKAIGIGKRLTRIRSLEKPPSLSTPQHSKTSTLLHHNNGKEKATVKNSVVNPSRNVSTLPRPHLDKNMKPQRNGKPHVVPLKGKIGPSNVPKKGSVPDSSPAITTTIIEAPETTSVPIEKATHMEEEELELDGVGQRDMLESPTPEEPQVLQLKEEPTPTPTLECEDDVAKLEIDDFKVDEENHHLEKQIESIEESKGDNAKEEKNSVANSKKEEAKAKKETAAAYNDVIEETARKLVEKKKGKVLALAGAFETVISLQEPQTPQGIQQQQHHHHHHEQQQQQQQHETMTSTVENEENVSKEEEMRTKSSESGVVENESMGSNEGEVVSGDGGEIETIVVADTNV